MATGLNTFCTWPWTETGTAYGAAVGNNFWLYFGVYIRGVCVGVCVPLGVRLLHAGVITSFAVN